MMTRSPSCPTVQQRGNSDHPKVRFPPLLFSSLLSPLHFPLPSSLSFLSPSLSPSLPPSLPPTRLLRPLFSYLPSSLFSFFSVFPTFSFSSLSIFFIPPPLPTRNPCSSMRVCIYNHQSRFLTSSLCIIHTYHTVSRYVMLCCVIVVDDKDGVERAWPDSDGFRYFLILQMGLNSSNNDCFFIGK